MLAWRLLWRNWRSGEVKILASALMLAVAVVGAITVFTDRLESALIKESASFLGADRIVRGSQAVDESLREQANQAGIAQAESIQFMSMVFAGDNMHLAAIKAVSEHYPLIGKLEVSEKPFAVRDSEIDVADGVPPSGQAWVDSRLLPLLEIDIGGKISVGEKELTVSKVVVREPDRGDGFSLFGARVMINTVDLPATEVIQPGSRITYNWLLAADEADMEAFIERLTPQLTDHQRVVDLESAQRGLARTLETGRRFLSLAGVIGVLLAGVAIAIAAQRFAARHVDQVALMKSLGAGAWQVRELYLTQMLLLALFASVAGLVLAEVIQRFITAAVVAVYPVSFAPADWLAYAMGGLTGFVCLVFFAIPPLWHLPDVPPLKILRQETEVSSVRTWLQGLLGVVAVFALVWMYSGDVSLTLSVILAVCAVLLMVAIGAWALLKAGRQLGMKAGSFWRLALASLQRHRVQSVTQILVFATAMMLLLTLISVRTSLIDEWRLQLPEDAPNHFILNIGPHEVEPLTELLSAQNLAMNQLYPMVRGRLIKINGKDPKDELQREPGILRREANLSWTSELREDNEIVSGQWWYDWNAAEHGVGVSVEQGVAETLKLELGDELSFSIGGLPMNATVASIRSLDWESMKPNFFFLFSPGALDDFTPTYLTSVFISAEQKPIINDMLRVFPTVVVIELDLVIDRIRAIIEQVSSGVELVLWLVIIGGLMVLFAAVNASMDLRMQEAGLLRALGCHRRLILSSVGVEFFALGFMAGLLAVIGSEALLLSLQQWVLNTPINPHYVMWLAGPLLGGLVVSALGVLSCRPIVSVPPGRVLREIAA